VLFSRQLGSQNIEENNGTRIAAKDAAQKIVHSTELCVLTGSYVVPRAVVLWCS
jgi:hypothetical protein